MVDLLYIYVCINNKQNIPPLFLPPLPFPPNFYSSM